jgi:dipeptidyl aminopeptidase/acylaminoacyl peptidase
MHTKGSMSLDHEAVGVSKNGTGPQLQPLTSEQIVNHKRPSDPKISPDGSRVLFTLRPISKSGEHDECAIWIVPFESGEPTQFTSATGADEEPCWSPDGSRVAFLSDRAERGKSSVYVMTVAGGEGIRIFDHEGDMASLTWSPDGSRLAVLFTVPETEEEKKRKEERDDVNVWDTEYKFQRLWVIDVDTKKAKCVSPPGRHVVQYAWSPNGQRLAINSIATPKVDEIFKATDLSIVSRDGGEPIAIHAPRGETQDLVWSGDGKRLAWIGPVARVVNPDYVYALSVDGGEPECLTPGYRGTVENLTPIDNGTELLVQGAEGLHSSLLRLTWDGTLTPILCSERGGSLPKPASITPDGRRCAFIWEDARTPPDVWVIDLGAGEKVKPLRRTHFNCELERAALGEPEIVRWESDENVEVEGLLFKPYGYVEGQTYPLVVQVHGGPTSRWADEFTGTWHDWAHSLAGRGIAVLMPNPRGSTGRGPEFSNAIFQDVGGGEFRDMMAGVDTMIERGIADPQRLAIGGWSWGGYMTAWAITRTNRFKAAIVGAGLPNMVSDNGIGDIPTGNLSYFERSVYEDPAPYWDRSAMKHLRNVTTPTLILHGEEDRRVAMPQGLELYTGLQSLGVETQFVTYPREPHGIQETKHQQDLIERVVDWYSKHLMPDA